MSDFNQSLASIEQLSGPRPVSNDEILQDGVGTVAAGKPNQPGGCSARLEELDEIAVFGKDHGICLSAFGENVRVLCLKKAKLRDVDRLALSEIPKPPSESRWELGIDPEGKSETGCHLRRQSRVVDPPCRVLEAGGNVAGLEIRIGLEDLALALPVSQEVEHVADPNPHPADTGPATALVWVDRDPV